jgi:drug/metabolite transporter (DMT)-like permease
MPNSPPFKFLLMRYALSIFCFLPWIAIMRVRWPSTRWQWVHLAISGVLMHAGYLGGVWAAVKAGMGSGLASLIVGLQPMLTAIWLSTLSGSVLTSRVARQQWIGLLLGFVGLALVVSRKLIQSAPGDATNLLNLSFATAALLCITAGTLYQKRFIAPCDVRTANTSSTGSSFFCDAPVCIAGGRVYVLE